MRSVLTSLVSTIVDAVMDLLEILSNFASRSPKTWLIVEKWNANVEVINNVPPDFHVQAVCVKTFVPRPFVVLTQFAMLENASVLQVIPEIQPLVATQILVEMI